MAVLGIAGPGAEVLHLRDPCLKVSQSSLQLFLRRGAHSGLPKARGPGPPGPPKTATGAAARTSGCTANWRNPVMEAVKSSVHTIPFLNKNGSV